MAARIYVVTDNYSKADRLIGANTAAQAIGYVTRDVFTAKAAGAQDVARLMGLGIKVENATGHVGQE